jgi:hypothetical protein
MQTVRRSITSPYREKGESFRDYYLRIFREEDGHSASCEPTPEQEEQIAVVDRVLKRSDEIYEKHGLLDDSTEILRQEREARSSHLARWSE